MVDPYLKNVFQVGAKIILQSLHFRLKPPRTGLHTHNRTLKTSRISDVRDRLDSHDGDTNTAM